jgi:Zn-dependent M28 family amino/carboxypeptidase
MGLSFFSSIVGAIMFALGGFDLWSWGFVFAGACSALQGAGILIAIFADQGEFSPGANVNASGVGTVLALAERLRQWPLSHTEVWTLCAGSHEVGGEGLRAFLDRYHDDVRDAWLIGFEGVGVGDRLIYFTREGLFRRPIQPTMIDLLQHTAQARPDLMPQPRSTTRRNTVVAPAIWRGFNSVCLSLYDEREGVPYWRSENDHSSHIQAASLAKVHEFAWELLQQIDEEQQTS